MKLSADLKKCEIFYGIILLLRRKTRCCSIRPPIVSSSSSSSAARERWRRRIGGRGGGGRPLWNSSSSSFRRYLKRKQICIGLDTNSPLFLNLREPLYISYNVFLLFILGLSIINITELIFKLAHNCWKLFRETPRIIPHLNVCQLQSSPLRIIATIPLVYACQSRGSANPKCRYNNTEKKGKGVGAW